MCVIFCSSYYVHHIMYVIFCLQYHVTYVTYVTRKAEHHHIICIIQTVHQTCHREIEKLKNYTAGFAL